jgi:hypothetical protein
MNISKREARAILEAIKSELANALSPDQLYLSRVAERLKSYLNQSSREEEAIAYARNQTTDDLEIDDEPATSLSEAAHGGDGGCWVAAWIYVPAAELTPESDRDNPRA